MQFSQQHNEIWRKLFGENLPGYMPDDAAERVRIGLGSRPDSMKVGLIPRASDFNVAQQRVEAGQGTQADSVRVGLLARPRAATAKETALDRLNIPAARKDSLLAGIPREKPEKKKEPSEKKQSLINLVKSGQITQAQADSIMGGVTRDKPDKGKERKKVGLIEKGAGYAKEYATTKKLLESKLPKEQTQIFSEIEAFKNAPPEQQVVMLADLMDSESRRRIFKEGTPAAKNLVKKLEAYADSSQIVNRAIERFTPDTDLVELLETIPVAQQAWNEFVQLSQRGGGDQAAAQQAAQVIEQKYGIDIETLRNVLYVKTGK